GEGRVRGRTSQLDPSDKAISHAQPPLTPTLSREGRGSPKFLRPRLLLLVQQYCGQVQRISILIRQREHGCFPRIGERSTRVLFSSVGSSLTRPGRHRDSLRANRGLLGREYLLRAMRETEHDWRGSQ